MFERKITQYLMNWKTNPSKNPLVIKGLRQVGKTFVVKEFARNNYENAFLLDFRKQPSLQTIFDRDFNIDEIALFISSLPKENRIISNSRMVPNKTILIFDEIQDCPNARSSLRYFKEDGRYDVICTGSLLGLNGYRTGKKTTRGIAVGSEEQIEMFPMDFEEFLWAINIEKDLINLIKQHIDEKKELPDYIHQRMLELVRQYICVGGMPDVVDAFVNTNDFSVVRATQLRLINDYKSDFGVHLNSNNELEINDLEKAKILDVFDSIPKQLAKENKKFQYVTIDKKAKARTHENAIIWLRDYGLIDICYNLSTIDEPFDFFAVKDQFKVYLSDIGLLIGMLDSNVQLKIMSNDLEIGKGMLYENLIADAFHKLKKPLYYFSKDSGLEIDFVTNISSTPYLVEVKAKNGNTKSANSVLQNPNYNIDELLKLTSQNIGYVEHKLTLPYYSAFYILGK